MSLHKKYLYTLVFLLCYVTSISSTTAIVLYGASCAGKSTTAKALCEKLNTRMPNEEWRFVGLDETCNNVILEKHDDEKMQEIYELSLLTNEAHKFLKREINVVIDTNICNNDFIQELKAENKLSIFVYAPLDFLLERDAIRTKNLGRSPMRALRAREWVKKSFANFETSTYDHRVDSSQQTTAEIITLILNALYKKDLLMNRDYLLAKLKDYKPTAQEEIKYKDEMIAFINKHADCFERSLEVGHITASAWLLNKDKTKALLMHHMKLDQWFQLGGHCDGNPDVLEVAIKEAQEESGIGSIEPVSEEIFDIDIHLIPENKKEKEHYHYDVRFLLTVTSDEQIVQNSESKELRWIGKNPAELPTHELSVVRMFNKWVEKKL